MRPAEEGPESEPSRRVPPPGKLLSGRRPYGLDDVDHALEALQAYSHEPRFEEELGRGVELLWEEADHFLDEGRRQAFELAAEESGASESWLLLDLALEDELRLVDHFLVEHGDRLANGERNYLLDLRDTFPSLYEVQAVGEDGLQVLDLWNDVLYEVEKPERDEPWFRWDLCAGRLLQRPGGPIVFELGFHPLPAGRARLLIERLDLQYDWLLAYEPNLCERPFLKTVGFLFHHFWVESKGLGLESWLGPQDRVVTLRYLVASVDACADALDGLAVLHPLRRHLWIHGEGDEAGPRGRPRPRLELLDDELRVQALAGRDQVALRQELERGLGTALTLVEERLEDREGMQRGLAGGVLRIPELPADRYGESFDAAIRSWLEEPSPWLRMRRPVDCIGDPELEGRVLDQIKLVENAQLRRAARGLACADLRPVWVRLGLAADGGAS